MSATVLEKSNEMFKKKDMQLQRDTDKLQTNLSNIKSAIVETYDSMSQSLAKDTFDELKEKQKSLHPDIDLSNHK